MGRCESRGYCWRVASASIRAYVLLLAGGNKIVTNKIQRVINAAARVVSGTRKYDRGLRQLRHAELHWLDVADRVTFKLSMTVHKWLHSHAPDYLSELSTPVAQVAERQRHSFCQPPPTRRAKNTARYVYGRRAFAVIGPSVWNALSNDLRDPELIIASFSRLLKSHLLRQYSAH